MIEGVNKSRNTTSETENKETVHHKCLDPTTDTLHFSAKEVICGSVFICFQVYIYITGQITINLWWKNAVHVRENHFRIWLRIQIISIMRFSQKIVHGSDVFRGLISECVKIQIKTWIW